MAKKASQPDSLPTPPEVVPPGRPEPAPHGEFYEEGPPFDGPGPDMGYPYDDGCCGPYDDPCNDDDCNYDPMAIFRFLALISRNLTVDAGVEGFKGPVDFGLVGNFGFHEGMNWGIAAFPWWEIGGQFGFEAVNSDFHDNEVVSGAREQFFLTAGLFHRAGKCGGLQYGVVYDYLRDDYFQQRRRRAASRRDQLLRRVRARDRVQGRGRLDRRRQRDHSQRGVPRSTARPVHLFLSPAVSSGRQLPRLGGFTGRTDGIFGDDFRIPISNYVAIESDFNYIIPHECSDLGSRESWNISMSLVFYLGGAHSAATAAFTTRCLTWRITARSSTTSAPRPVTRRIRCLSNHDRR